MIQKNKIPTKIRPKKNKNDNGNNTTDPNIPTGNDKNMVYNRRIEHATTATVINNRFTTKCTLDIGPEKPNYIINSSKIHQKIFELIKKYGRIYSNRQPWKQKNRQQ